MLGNFCFNSADNASPEMHGRTVCLSVRFQALAVSNAGMSVVNLSTFPFLYPVAITFPILTLCRPL